EPRRRRRGVEHGDIRRRADNNQRAAMPFVQFRLKRATHKFVEGVRVEDWLGFSSLERRGDFPQRCPLSRGGDSVKNRHRSLPGALEELSEGYHQLRTDFLRIFAATTQVKYDDRRRLAVEFNRLRLRPVRPFLRHLNSPR